MSGRIPFCTHQLHPGPIDPDKFVRKHECTRKARKGPQKGQRINCPWLEYH